MTDPLLERVAMALWQAEVKLFGYNEDAADDLWRRQQRNYNRQARTAIEASRVAAYEEALAWAETHDPWLVEQIRDRAALSPVIPDCGGDDD